MGIEMKRMRFCVLLLAVLLLATACAPRFSQDGAGQGYTDQKTDTFYAAMPAAFEAASREGEPIGEFEDEEFERVLAFYAIPKLDAKEFITDEYGYVYCALDPMPEFKDFSPNEILVCEEDAVSVELYRVTGVNSIAALATAWKAGEELELPMVKATTARRLKLASPLYPNLYYCISFYAYESGEVYLHDSESDHTVACPEALAELILKK